MNDHQPSDSTAGTPATPVPAPGKPRKKRHGTSARTRAQGPHRALRAAPRPQPPKAGPAELRRQALLIGDQQDRTGIRLENTDPAVRVPARLYDEEVRSVTIGIARDLREPDAAPLAAAAGEDPARIQNNLDRQAALWDGLGELLAIQAGARMGRLLVDKARLLVRSLIDAATERRLATLIGDERSRLESDRKEILTQQARFQADLLAQRTLAGAITQSGTPMLARIAQVRNLLSTLDILDSGQEPPWDVLVKAGAILDLLKAQAGAPEPDPEPPEAEQPEDQRGTER